MGALSFLIPGRWHNREQTRFFSQLDPKFPSLFRPPDFHVSRCQARRALRQRRPLESGELDPIYPVIPFFKAGTLVSDPSASYVKSDVGPKKATTDTTDHATPPRPQANPRRWKCSTCLALNGPGLNCKGGPRVCCVCGTERPRGITRGEDLSTASYISHSLRTAGLDNAKRSSRTSLKLVAPCKKVASARSIDDRGSKAGGAGQGQGRARVWSWLWPGRKRGCEDGKWRLDAGKAVADAVETPGVTGDDKNKSSKRGASTYKPPTTTADFRPSAKDGEVLPPVVAQGRSRSAGQETSAAAVVERESPPGKDNDDARTEHRDEQPVGIDVPPAVRDMPGFEDHPLCWEEDGAWFFRSKTS